MEAFKIAIGLLGVAMIGFLSIFWLIKNADAVDHMYDKKP